MKKDFKEKKEYDVIIIGAGSGGLNIAGFASRVGLEFLLIDKEDKTIGGDCLNFGCVPSKALIHIGELVKNSMLAKDFGMDVSGDVDIFKVMNYIDSKKEFIRKHENAEYLRKKGIDVVLGLAKFSGKNKVIVRDEEYVGKKIILATGSRPRYLKIPGIENIQVFNNENIFSLKNKPQNMIIVGGGPIGAEIAQSFNRLGINVSIVGPSFLDKEDKDVSEVVKDKMQKEGVRFFIGYKPVEIKNKNILIIEDGDGEKKEIKFDLFFVSIGRILNLDNLNLESAGIELDERGKLKIDQYLRTTNKNVIAIGDVAGNFMFTHAAELHASTIINNLFSPFKKKLNTDAMAWVTYTDPEIATFGLQEHQLRKRSIKYEVIQKEYIDDRMIVDEYMDGLIKLFISPKGIIFGGSMVAHNAGELSQELMLAQSNQMNVRAFMNKVYPYPTATRANRSAILQYMSKKLTDKNKKLLRVLFHIFN